MISGIARRCRQIWMDAAMVTVCAVLLLLAACETKPSHTPPPLPKVTVSRPARQNVTDYLELSGNTQAVNSFPASGQGRGLPR